MLSSVSYIRRLPYFFKSTLLYSNFYLMKVLKVILTFRYNPNDIFFGRVVTDWVVFGNSSNVDFESRNTGTIAIDIKLHFFIRIVL